MTVEARIQRILRIVTFVVIVFCLGAIGGMLLPPIVAMLIAVVVGFAVALAMMAESFVDER